MTVGRHEAPFVATLFARLTVGSPGHGPATAGKLKRSSSGCGAHADVGGAEAGGVGGPVVGLGLRLALGGDAGDVVLDLASDVGIVPAEDGGDEPGDLLGDDRAAVHVSIDTRVRRASTSSRCRAPSCEAAYTASTRRHSGAPVCGSARLGSASTSSSSSGSRVP